MPINSFSVGKDVTLDIVSPIGGLVALSNITNFNSRQMTVDRNSHGIDGINRFLDIPSGWEGSFKLDRNTQNYDLWITQIEAAYYAGTPLNPGTITETITNPDGTVMQFQYQGCSFKFPNVGEWSGDNKVEQTLDFRASKRVQIV